MNQHPLSAAFPAMSAEDFQALKDSIEAIGIQSPITVLDGMVLDGWHRYTAAKELGIQCPSADLGDVDPRDFVLAQNKARRHITQAQLAMATAAVCEWAPVGVNQHEGRVGTQCPPSQKTTSELASIAGVGERTIKQAKTVQTKAAPEVVDAVKRGEIGLPKAAAIAQLPKEQQAEAISKPLAEIKPKAPAPQPAPQDHEGEGEDLHAMLEEMQRECEGAARRLADWERAMSGDGREALVTAIKRYEHAEREKALSDQRAAQYQRQRDEALNKIKSIGRAIGEPDPDKVVRAVQAMARAAKAEA